MPSSALGCLLGGTVRLVAAVVAICASIALIAQWDAVPRGGASEVNAAVVRAVGLVAAVVAIVSSTTFSFQWEAMSLGRVQRIARAIWFSHGVAAEELVVPSTAVVPAEFLIAIVAAVFESIAHL